MPVAADSLAVASVRGPARARGAVANHNLTSDAQPWMALCLLQSSPRSELVEALMLR